jgi:L-lactate dehydrogenase
MRYGTPLGPKVDIVDGDYDDLKGAGIVLITVGVNEKIGGATDRNDPLGRLKLLDKNAEIYRDIVPRIVRAEPNAVLLVVSDPPDPLADIARQAPPRAAVLSTGTYLDSQRFRVHLGKHFGADPAHVEAQVIGDHGTSQVFLWSSARIGGVPMAALLEKAASAWTSCRTSSSETCATPTSPSSKGMMPANMASASYRPGSPRWCSMTNAR